MSRVVLVHGIGQQYKGEETLLADWYPALADGMTLASDVRLPREDVSMAFYGDLFRPAGHRGLGIPELDASDVSDDMERDLLIQWWTYAAEIDPRVPGPDAPARLRTPHLVQRALDALSHSAFFAGLSERFLIWSARQVRVYFTDAEVRSAVQRRMERGVTARTEVIVAHSLGSVVAYEALCAHPEWQELSFVTLGSPLGIRNLTFDRLTPRPVDGRGHWPGPVKRWINVADRGDVVPVVKRLADRFGDEIEDVSIHNGARAHDVTRYLTARETGRRIAETLTPDP